MQTIPGNRAVKLGQVDRMCYDIYEHVIQITRARYQIIDDAEYTFT